MLFNTERYQCGQNKNISLFFLFLLGLLSNKQTKKSCIFDRFTLPYQKQQQKRKGIPVCCALIVSPCVYHKTKQNNKREKNPVIAVG